VLDPFERQAHNLPLKVRRMTDVLDFSTADIPRKERLDQWRRVTGLFATAPEDESFEGHFRAGAVGAVRMFSVAANEHRVVGAPHQIDQSRRFAFKLLFQQAGSLRIEQDGQRLDLPQGHWCIYNRALPYVTQSSDDCRQVGLLIPHRRLSAGWFDVESHLLASFSAASGVGRVLHDSAMAAMSGIEGFSGRSGEGLSDALCDLVRLALLEHGHGAVQRSSMADLRERARLHIEQNLDDPDLTITKIAQAMGCSKRYVHKAFNETDTTVSKLIWILRVERCRRELQRCDIPGVSITEICYSWGFNDSHHFSRLFKSRFGLAPREFRRRFSEGSA
jgi:AraC-like DNA-binding protein